MERPSNYRRALYLSIAVVALSLATTLLADTIVLNDGTRIEGKVLEEKEGFVTFQLRDGHTTIRFEKSDALNIQRERTPEPDLLDHVLLSPSVTDEPKPPSQSPSVTPLPSAGQRPVRVGVSTAVGPSATPKPPRKGRPSEWYLPEAVRHIGFAPAIIAGGLVLITPTLALFLWGMAYLVRIEEPTLLKSLAVALVGIAVFLIGFLALQGLDVPASLDAYIFLLVVVFVIAVAVARAVYAASLFQAFLLWGLPTAVVVAIVLLLGGRI